MPYLEKAKILLDHLEKVVLLAALGALGYFAITNKTIFFNCLFFFSPCYDIFFSWRKIEKI